MNKARISFGRNCINYPQKNCKCSISSDKKSTHWRAFSLRRILKPLSNPGRHSFVVCPGLDYSGLSGRKFTSFGGTGRGLLIPQQIVFGLNRPKALMAVADFGQFSKFRIGFTQFGKIGNGSQRHIEVGVNQFLSSRNVR